jgi:predicted amidohydrolase YtcJ
MNDKQIADTVMHSTSIFTATGDQPISGFVALAGEKILALGGGMGTSYIGPETLILELGDRTVCPGFSDVHCFFSGYAMRFVGVDASGANTVDEVIDLARRHAQGLSPGRTILGHGLREEILQAADGLALDKAFLTQPIVLFAQGGEGCWMNAAARSKYQFSPETCYPEAYWRLFGEIVTDRDFIVPEFMKYMAMLNSRGVTAIKEMGFDDYYGFTDILAGMAAREQLSLHVSFMSQPVGRGLDLPYGLAMRSRFNETQGAIRFSGYNRMTDGSISQLCGDLKTPYLCAPQTRCMAAIDYPLIEREVLAADEAGFRFSLHAQGDAAIAKAVDIFEKCQRDSRGRLVNRHAITDVEFSDPVDLERMGKLGVIAEVYPQIMSLADRAAKVGMIEAKIGPKRGKYYWNRRKMVESGIVLSCGTDLPLLIPDIPESIYHACGGLFPEGGEAFNLQNTISIPQLLTAWTKNGAYNLYQDDIRGSLEVGKLADLVVFDRSLFSTPLEEVRKTAVYCTYWKGKKVYQNPTT